MSDFNEILYIVYAGNLETIQNSNT